MNDPIQKLDVESLQIWGRKLTKPDKAVEDFMQELQQLCSYKDGDVILPKREVVEDLYKRHPTIRISLRRAAMIVHKRIRQIERNQLITNQRTRKPSFMAWLKSWFR